MSAIVAEPARAGIYVMRNCDVPGYAYAPLHPWAPPYPAVSDVSPVDACPSGGGWSLNVVGDKTLGGGASRALTLALPLPLRQEISFVKLVLWYATRLTGSGQPLYFMSGDARAGGSFQTWLFYPPPGSEDMVAEQQLSPTTTSIQLGIQCGPGGVVSPEPCVVAHDTPLLVRGIEVTLREDVPPFLLPPRGTLLESGPQSGVRTMTYSASDQQSGLSKVEALMDGTVVASEDLTSRCPHADFTVCPASVDGSLQIDTRTVGNGAHRVTLRAEDAAGNERVVNVAEAIEVANAPAPSDAAYTITSQFKGSSGAVLTVPYGRRVLMLGRLMQASQPVATGTTIDLLKKLEGRGSQFVPGGHVITQPDGSFSLRLPTTRPSRTVRLAYRPPGAGQIVGRALKLRVHAASRMQASLRGRLVRFSGRVLSGPIPRRGKRIVMEGRGPGSAWTAFRALRTNRTGRFSGTYRLRVRRPGVTLKVRAAVPSESGYGYVGSRSRAVTLRVR